MLQVSIVRCYFIRFCCIRALILRYMYIPELGRDESKMTIYYTNSSLPGYITIEHRK